MTESRIVLIRAEVPFEYLPSRFVLPFRGRLGSRLTGDRRRAWVVMVIVVALWQSGDIWGTSRLTFASGKEVSVNPPSARARPERRSVSGRCVCSVEVAQNPLCGHNTDRHAHRCSRRCRHRNRRFRPGPPQLQTLRSTGRAGLAAILARPGLDDISRLEFRNLE